MLIRSQDKRMIVNFDNICTVSAFPEKDSEDIYVEDGTGSLMVGRYSTKAKAMKVLDMIQEAYERYEYEKPLVKETTCFSCGRKVKANVSKYNGHISYHCQCGTSFIE